MDWKLVGFVALLAALALIAFLGYRYWRHRQQVQELRLEILRSELALVTKLTNLIPVDRSEDDNLAFVGAMMHEIAEDGFEKWMPVSFSTGEQVDVVDPIWQILRWCYLHEDPRTAYHVKQMEHYRPIVPTRDRIHKLLQPPWFDHRTIFNLYQEMDDLVRQRYPDLVQELERYRKLRIYSNFYPE